MVQKKKSGGARKLGRNKDKCKRYRIHMTRYKNKLRRVLRSSGDKAAKKYERLYHRLAAEDARQQASKQHIV